MSRFLSVPGLRPARRPLRWALLVLVLAAVGWLAVRQTLPRDVATLTLAERDIERTLVVVGRVRTRSRTGLGASVSGAVREVRVRVGDRVERGQTLLVLDDREAVAAVAQAEATIAEVSASVTAAVQRAETEARQAQRDLERIRAVFGEGALTQQQVDQAEQRASDAQSALGAARAALGDTDAVNASVARARAALEAARARLALTRIRAPSDGTILRRAVEPGDAVQAGRVLLEHASDGPTELVVFPSEENLGQLRLGAPAVASADAYPDRTFEALVSLIAPAVDPEQGTVEVRLSVSEPPDYLLPDMTLSVNIETGRKSGAAVLPASAVRGLGGSDAWVAVVRSGRLERQDVGIGLRGTDFVEILSGLSDRDLVVPPEGSPDLGERVHARSEG